MARSGPLPAAMALRMSIVAVRQTPSSIGSVEVVGEVVGAVQHEAAAGLDRAADVDRHRPGYRSAMPSSASSADAEALQEVGEGDVRGALVDDEAHRPILGVRAQVDDRARKTRVGHHRHGDEELAIEIAFGGGATRAGTSDLHGVRITRRLAGCEAVNWLHEPRPVPLIRPVQRIVQIVLACGGGMRRYNAGAGGRRWQELRNGPCVEN